MSVLIYFHKIISTVLKNITFACVVKIILQSIKYIPDKKRDIFKIAILACKKSSLSTVYSDLKYKLFIYNVISVFSLYFGIMFKLFVYNTQSKRLTIYTNYNSAKNTYMLQICSIFFFFFTNPVTSPKVK